jgi:hypothetical protein
MLSYNKLRNRKEIEIMNQQEIFDKVASHLITQGVKATYRRSGGYPSCAYRGDNGTMCAAGCLIPDEEYNPEFEGIPWMGVRHDIPSLASLTDKDHALIISLQGVHDDDSSWYSIDILNKRLNQVASKYGLSTDILN